MLAGSPESPQMVQSEASRLRCIQKEGNMAFDKFRGRAWAIKTVATDTDSSVSQVHRWITSEKIKAVKLGPRMTRIDGDSLADFLTDRLSAPRPPRGRHAKKPNAIELAGQV